MCSDSVWMPFVPKGCRLLRWDSSMETLHSAGILRDLGNLGSKCVHNGRAKCVSHHVLFPNAGFIVRNIGVPIAEQAGHKSRRLMEAEMAEFQLESTENFHPHAACFLYDGRPSRSFGHDERVYCIKAQDLPLFVVFLLVPAIATNFALEWKYPSSISPTICLPISLAF